MPPKKRGRKPKPKPDPSEKPPPKKRGRKPKGGKIVLKKNEKIKNKIIEKPNIILHLKCSSESLENSEFNDEFNEKMPKSFSINKNNKINNLNYKKLNSKKEVKENIILTNTKIAKKNDSDLLLKDIWEKLYKLKQNLKINNVTDKKSACIEEIAYNMGYIDSDKLLQIAESMRNSDYGKYLIKIANKKN